MRNLSARVLHLLKNSRAKNALKDEVIVEVMGKKANTFCYQRNGDIQPIKQIWNRFLGWMKTARNPKLIAAKGEAIVVRIGTAKSFLLTAEGIQEIPNDYYTKLNKNK